MPSSHSTRASGTGAAEPMSHAEVRNRCRTIIGLLENTSKTGARDLSVELDRLPPAVLDTQDDAVGLLPRSSAIIAQLQAVEAAVRYWTDKGLDARLQRRKDQLLKNGTPNTLGQCCTQARNILSSIADTNVSSGDAKLPSQAPAALDGVAPASESAFRLQGITSPEPTPDPEPSLAPQLPAISSAPTEHHVTDPPLTTSESKTKDAVLGGFKAILKSASGVADVIPDPVGKIVKMIADTGVKVMDVLDDVSDNKDEARKLGAHIRGSVQAIIQYLPHKKEMPSEGIQDVGLVGALDQFLSTLTTVLGSLDTLRSQGRFKNLALHEQNKGEMEGFGRDIGRAFQNLQVCLELRMLHLLYGMQTANVEDRRLQLLDRLGGSNNGAQEKGSSVKERICLPGTRTKVLASIEAWIEEPSSEPVLWLNAVAGCGKSTIASTIAQRREELGATAAIFYCTAGDQAHCSTIVRSLALWLARSSRGSLEMPILQAIKDMPIVADLPLADQVQLLLSNPLKNIAPDSPPAVIIIDGLDEWYDVKKTTALISLLVDTASSTNVKLLITSRDEQHIRKSFNKFRANPSVVRSIALDHDVDINTVNGDIRRYLEHNFEEMHKDPELELHPDWPGDDRMASLVRKSEGLFQFAATVLRFLYSGYPPAILNDVLDNHDTAGRLDYLYLTIFQGALGKSLDHSTLPLLRHVLQCLICAPVPVSLEVIAYLRCESTDFRTAYGEIRHSVLNHLGSFLVVPENPSTPIRFLHTSIVDFLTDSARCTDFRFCVNQADGNAQLAQLCFRRLNRDLMENICEVTDYACRMDFPDGEGNADDDPEDGARIPSKLVSERVHAGLRYAAFYWADHLTGMRSSPIPFRLEDLIQEFASAHILNWMEAVALLGAVLSVGHPSARKAADWCSHVSFTDLSGPTSLFRDTSRFIGLFTKALSSCPLTLYAFLLSFVPTESILRKRYETGTNKRAKVIRGPIQERWPAHQWTASRGHGVLCIAISPDGAIVASGGKYGMIRLWDAASGMPKGEPLEGHSDWVRSLAFTRDGKYLVSSSEDCTIRIWEVETGQSRGIPLTGHAKIIRTVAISPDDTIVASGSDDGTIRFWDFKIGRGLDEPLEVGAGRVTSVAFTPDGSTVVCGCWDRSIRRWSVKTGKAIGDAMMGHTKRVLSVCVSPDGKMIASGSEDESIRLWDAETGKGIGAPLKGDLDEVKSVAFSPDGKTLVSGSDDMTIRLWNTRTGKQMGKALTAHTFPVYGVAFSPDGKTVVSGSWDRTVRVWDVEGVEDEGEWVEGHSETVWSVAFTADGRTVASGSVDGWVMLWSTETGSLLGKVERGYGRRLRFSAGGRALRWSGWDGVVREWDVSGAAEGTGAKVRQVEPDKTLEFPKIVVEKLKIDDEGWIERDGKKWLWVPRAYGWDAPCYVLGTTLVLATRPVPILDVSGLL